MDGGMSYTALIDRVVEVGGSVRRLWSPEARLAIWVGLLALAVGGLVVRLGSPFAAGAGRAPSPAWEVVAAAVGAAAPGGRWAKVVRCLFGALDWAQQSALLTSPWSKGTSGPREPVLGRSDKGCSVTHSSKCGLSA